MLTHGDYLIKPLSRTIVPIVGLFVVNILALVAIVVWIGTMLGNFAAVAELVRPLEVTQLRLWPSTSTTFSFDGWGDIAELGPVLPFSVLVLASVTALGRGIYAVGAVRQTLYVLLGLAGIWFFGPPTFRFLSDVPSLRTISGWWPVLIAALGAMVVALAVTGVLIKLKVYGRLSAAANWSQRWATRALFAGMALCAGSSTYPILAAWFRGESSEVDILIFFTVLIAPLVLDPILQRSSVQRLYQDRIRTCFGVVRNGPNSAGVPASSALLSEVGSEHRPFSHPQLLICATANVWHRTRTAGSHAFAPFVFSHDVCGVPGTDARFETSKLENGRVRRSWSKDLDPAVSLSMAVAATGAALAPSMGRGTQPSLRPLFAAVNVRLGWWLPNAFLKSRRSEVEAMNGPSRFKYRRVFGRGYDDLLPEMFGVAGANMYVTDGGHYDNLGLSALIRSGCAEIWSVDASPDKSGSADELRRVLDLAVKEGHILGHTIDLDVFKALPSGSYRATHVHGNLTYPNGKTADLHVMKLGLTNEAPEKLRKYRAEHPLFPFHPTPLQWYGQKRMEAYRDLGSHTATSCLDSLGQVQRLI
ncbi:hypothetical protein J2Y41_004036 [Arthrobacter sp. 1088]|uniref:hypothetical protein n=1 Tax=Arthrobacter sp. 1088 TaxID=2817768 RepID=UPI002864AB2D|nr:hypothetical protein [Arthrobacter sp. 1088]MDR6688446.1 hypothetical protein [Arthrobacter sp. 1088]